MSLISTAAVRAENATQARPDEIGGSWKFLVLDGRASAGSIHTVSRTSSGNDPVAVWSLQLGIVSPSMQVHPATFGPAAGTPIAGDFNGDGFAEIGVFADGRWYLDMNASNVWDAGDLLVSFGAAGDQPVVGDWNQDGKADLGVYTPLPGSHAVAVVGDWTGTGVDRIGLFNDGVWRLDADGDGRLTSSDATLQLGQAGDCPVVGDFNRDGRDELGVYRRGQWLLDSSSDRRFGTGDLGYAYGGVNDLPVVGDWDGDGRDQIGLVHR